MPDSANASPDLVLADFDGWRSDMLAVFRVWIMSGPDRGIVNQEIEATASAMRQIARLGGR